MDHEAEAIGYLTRAERVRPDTINDAAKEAEIAGLIGIGHALLSLGETFAAAAGEIVQAVECVATEISELPLEAIRTELADLNAEIRAGRRTS